MSFKKCFLFLLPAIVILADSCDTVNNNPLPVTTPSIWGQMAAIKETNIAITGTDTIVTEKERGSANFYADPQSTSLFVDAGNVALNDVDLLKDGANNYTVSANTLDLINRVNWHVPGNSSIPNCTFNYTDTFPDYIVPLPDKIVKTSGLTLTFDTSTVRSSDSVRVYIHDGSGPSYFMKTFYAGAGNITIAAAELSGLASVSDHSATIGIFPYRGKIKVFNSKGIYFIKERRRYQSINIF